MAKTWPKAVEQEEELIRENMGLIALVIKRHFRAFRCYYDDLFAAGMAGLLLAIRTHDPGTAKLTTHAVWKIRSVMGTELGRLVRTQVDHHADPPSITDQHTDHLPIRESFPLDCLTPNERLVILLKYDESISQIDIAAMMDVCKQRVFQLHRSALGKLRRALTEAA